MRSTAGELLCVGSKIDRESFVYINECVCVTESFVTKLQEQNLSKKYRKKYMKPYTITSIERKTRNSKGLFGK